MTRSNRPSLVLAAVLLTPACGDKDVLMHDSGSGSGGSGAATDGSWSADDAYADCRSVSHRPYYAGEGCPSNGSHRFGATTDGCDTCLCRADCRRAADCPAPADASAEPRCWKSDCVLECGDGQTCPQGMECVPSEDYDADVCAWVVRDVFACAGDDPTRDDASVVCNGVGTRQECEALVAHSGLAGCRWVEETILSSASETCEPAATTSYCQLAERSEEDTCQELATCTQRQFSTYWYDLGAGTVALVDFDDCRWQPLGPPAPVGPPAHFEPCDFGGNPAIPLVCACTCQ